LSEPLGELPQHPHYQKLYVMIDSEIDSRVEQLLGKACTSDLTEINELGGELRCLRALRKRLIEIEEESHG